MPSLSMDLAESCGSRGEEHNPRFSAFFRVLVLCRGKSVLAITFIFKRPHGGLPVLLTILANEPVIDNG